MSYPKSRDEWWTQLDEHWGDILEIFCLVGFNLTAPVPHVEAKIDLTSFASYLEKLKKDRDVELLKWLSRAWIEAPDRPYIHEWPSWGYFCDLCSEGPVLLFGT